MPNYRLTCTLSNGSTINAGTINVPSSGGGGYLYVDGESFSGENWVGNDSFYEFLVHLTNGEWGVRNNYGNILFTGTGYREGKMYMTFLFCNAWEDGQETDEFTSYGLLLNVYMDACAEISCISGSAVYKNLINSYEGNPLDGSDINPTLYGEYVFTDIDSESSGGVAMTASDGIKFANLILSSIYAGDDMVQVNEKSNLKGSLGMTFDGHVEVPDIQGVQHDLMEGGSTIELLNVFNSQHTYIAYLERKFIT